VKKEKKILKKTPRPKELPREDSLSKNQKLALAALGVFALFVMVLWVMQLRGNIFSPLDYNKKKNAAVATGEQCPGGSCLLNAEEKAKNQDTDGDGLSDWDELNSYKTSPYLEDSDSDGIDDGTEVKNSTDPNCPQGRDCSLSGSLVSGSGASISTSSNAASTEEQAIQSSAAVLRQALIDSGSFKKEDLDKISDQDLMVIYQEAAKQLEAGSN
jgi:hypothetical protein